MVAKNKPTPKRTSKGTRRTRVATEKPQKVRIPTGIAADLQVEDVLLEEINHTDARFQFRVDRDNIGDLVASFKEEGQQQPVLLWGKRKPHLVIDGHRRIKTAARLGLTSIKAIIRTDLTEEQAYRVAYLENAQRKSFNKLDQANALWVLHHKQGMNIQDAGATLGMSKDKASRLLQFLEMPGPIQKAVREGTITMHHAMVLRKHPDAELRKVLAEVEEEKLSARALAKRLGKAKTRGRKKTYFRREGDGFRLPPIRFSPKTATEAMRTEMLSALEKAVEALKASNKPAVKEPAAKEPELPKTL